MLSLGSECPPLLLPITIYFLDESPHLPIKGVLSTSRLSLKAKNGSGEITAGSCSNAFKSINATHSTVMVKFGYSGSSAPSIQVIFVSPPLRSSGYFNIASGQRAPLRARGVGSRLVGRREPALWVRSFPAPSTHFRLSSGSPPSFSSARCSASCTAGITRSSSGRRRRPRRRASCPSRSPTARVRRRRSPSRPPRSRRTSRRPPPSSWPSTSRRCARWTGRRRTKSRPATRRRRRASSRRPNRRSCPCKKCVLRFLPRTSPLRSGVGQGGR